MRLRAWSCGSPDDGDRHVQRKKTLLVEYRQLRKANSFVDRRFGGEACMRRPMHAAWHVTEANTM